MCFLPYPVPKPRNKAKKPTIVKKTTGGGTFQGGYKTADEAINQTPTMSYNPRATPPPHWYYTPYSMEQRLEMDEPNYVTRSQWASHCEALKGTHDIARENGNRMNDMKLLVSGGIAEARDAVISTQNTVKGAHESVKNTHTAVQGVQDTLKQACDTINKNHVEQISKQDSCTAEITKLRALMEDDAKRRDEAHQRQQARQEAYNHAYNYFQHINRDAELRSPGVDARTQPSTTESGRTNASQRARGYRRVPDETERRQHRDDDDDDNIKRVVEGLFGEGYQEDTYPHHGNHFHFHGCLPLHIDDYTGWPTWTGGPPGWDYYGETDGFRGRVLPRTPPRPVRRGRGWPRP
ncbi:uncharacterized protein F4822DRAFT_433564 [Hypoxylon trugodes]|uniref:uncharacterized protein n=1 Tax=Hypoxylon trugodes TaxID=326681 RepID=UPI0021A1C07C|nr:uncharacterized protein F4822DRAFT_433564 [Hypoxylon trugodes]KAI1385036.1 hypothetical protein F4822DRAFT_433564 [Hypoxylon trugodes]